MAWLYIILAAAIDATWVTLTKLYGFSRWPIAVLIVAMAISIPFIFGQGLKTLSTGPAYATFVGLATIGVVAASALLAGEALSWQKLIFIALIVAGIIGLHMLEIPAKPAA
jgi:quaternary ammonium compound-resistance protein SugE